MVAARPTSGSAGQLRTMAASTPKPREFNSFVRPLTLVTGIGPPFLPRSSIQQLPCSLVQVPEVQRGMHNPLLHPTRASYAGPVG
jgi:hypothetical protein